MLKKSFGTLKNNPVLILLFLAAVVVYAVPMLLFLPEVRNIMEISRGIAENPANASSMDLSQMTSMLMSTLKLYLYLLLLAVLGIVFLSGYGNMLAAAVNEGKASWKIFLFGIRKFLGKVILSALLLLAITFGFSLILSTFTIPYTMAGIFANKGNPGNMMESQLVITTITMVLSVFLYPMIELWLPAVFLEKEEGVVSCFRKGIRASLRKYLPLLTITAVMILPLLILYIVSGDIYSIMDSPFYIISFVYQAVIAPILLTFLFHTYRNQKNE